MEQVILKALTPDGERALHTIKEKVDVPLRQRFIYRRMFEERVVDEDPYTLRITPKGTAFRAVAANVRVADFIAEIEHALADRGVAGGVDYTIEGK